MKEESRCALRITGLQFVIASGIKGTQKLHAGNLDTQEVI